MSVVLDAASSQYLLRGTIPVSGVPLTMACWFNPNDVTSGRVLMCIADGGDNTNYFDLRASGNIAGDPVRCMTYSVAANGLADTGNSYVASTWQHACAVFADTDDRSVYLDGDSGNKGTDSTDVTPAGLDRMSIGVNCRLALVAYFDGSIAEAAIWNEELSDDEVASLAAGFSPLLIRVPNLVAYWPLMRNNGANADYVDVMRGSTMLDMGGPVDGDHPPGIFQKTSCGLFQYGYEAAGVGGYSSRGIGRGIMRGVLR